MYNTKFILDNGKELYPGYLEKENREHIKMQYAGRRGFMRCGCKPSENLFYNISEDLRIYPEHNNYQHDFFCCRYKDNAGKESRRTAFFSCRTVRQCACRIPVFFMRKQTVTIWY